MASRHALSRLAQNKHLKEEEWGLFTCPPITSIYLAPTMVARMARSSKRDVEAHVRPLNVDNQTA